MFISEHPAFENKKCSNKTYILVKKQTVYKLFVHLQICFKYDTLYNMQ